MANIAVIFAGGIGRRMNNKALPKQFLKLRGKEIIIYTLEHFENHAEIDGIVIACVEEWIPYLQKMIDKYQLKKVAGIVPGGTTGQDSIFQGLDAAGKIYGREGIVLIHDGVRPLIEEKTITDCLASVRTYGSAITVAPVVETIIRVDGDDRIKDVIERSECLVARAPQCFYLCDILESHQKAQKEQLHDFIDSASIMRYYGYSLATVSGPVENIKITTPMDFYTFRALYDAREGSQLFGS
ncbi:MAG: IspD/TarI family cytidylyltransferase [Lachnospiraceae bacterium]